MYNLYYLYSEPQSEDALGTLQHFIVWGGSLVIFIAVLFLFFVVYARRKQNRLFLLNKVIKEDFEKQLLESKIETQEETFSVLSKELHDNVGQLLNSSKLLIGIAKRKPSAPVEILNMASDTLGKAIYEIRSLAKALDKEWLQQFNFMDNLETEIRRLNITDELTVHFVPGESLPLNNDEQIILFRIVQEALQNAIKHSGANNIYVTSQQASDLLTLTVTDDGIGMEKSVPTENGIGFINMKHRAQLLGGSVSWQSDTNRGTTISIQIPVKPLTE